jgi:hypothetical protein
MNDRPRHILLVYGVSLALFALSPLFRTQESARIPKGLTDHVAHWGTAILAWYDGFDIYRKPLQQLCMTPDPVPEDWVGVPCTLPDHPSIRTFSVNWPQYPSVYPPGAAVFAALPAALYATTSTSFSTVNLVMVLECLVATHVASLLLLLSLWRKPDEPSAPALVGVREWNASVLLFLMPIFHLYMVSWALRGIYDAAAVAGVVAGALMLRRDRPVAALVALSFAVFTHFRALWYLPLLALALWRTLQSLEDRVAPPRKLAALVLALAMLLMAGVAFAILFPSLKNFKVNNPINPGDLTAMQMFVHGLPVLLVLVAFGWNGQWLMAATAAWQVFMLVRTPEVRPWHALFALPLLAVAGQERRAAPVAVVVALCMFLTECRVVFNTWPFTGQIAAIMTRE